MESSSKKFTRKEPILPSSMTDARFVQSLLLATPLYFYYQHLTPPGYFSNLLKGLVQMRNANEEQNVVVECGINLSCNTTSKLRYIMFCFLIIRIRKNKSICSSAGKRKNVFDGPERKAKKTKDRADASPRATNSPDQPPAVSPSLP